MSRFLGRTALIGLATVLVSACATTRAETPRERPALEVPVPPPRVITPLAPPQAPMPQPVPELPNNAPAPTRPRPQRQPESTAKPEKPEEKPADPNPAPANPTAPVPQLRTPEVGNASQTAAQIRDTIERTKKTLENIDYRTLVPDRQKVYDDSKLFYMQAEENLKNNNLLVAKELADKAEKLAKGLQGR